MQQGGQRRLALQAGRVLTLRSFSATEPQSKTEDPGLGSGSAWLQAQGAPAPSSLSSTDQIMPSARQRGL